MDRTREGLCHSRNSHFTTRLDEWLPGFGLPSYLWSQLNISQDLPCLGHPGQLIVRLRCCGGCDTRAGWLLFVSGFLEVFPSWILLTLRPLTGWRPLSRLVWFGFFPPKPCFACLVHTQLSYMLLTACRRLKWWWLFVHQASIAILCVHSVRNGVVS